MNRPDYQAICDKYGIVLHMGTPEGVDPMTNRSCCYGCDEIVIGEYDDLECEVLGFFHELGHCISGKEHCLPEFDTWPYHHYHEAVAWKLGFRLAADEGYEEFSEDALEWARGQLSSYFMDDHPEHSPMKHLPFALRTAGLTTFVTLEEAVADRLHIIGLDIDLAADDPFWTTNQFPPEVQEKLREARRLWGEATAAAHEHAKKEFD